jgi:hypothetical protein
VHRAFAAAARRPRPSASVPALRRRRRWGSLGGIAICVRPMRQASPRHRSPRVLGSPLAVRRNAPRREIARLCRCERAFMCARMRAHVRSCARACERACENPPAPNAARRMHAGVVGGNGAVPSHGPMRAKAARRQIGTSSATQPRWRSAPRRSCRASCCSPHGCKGAGSARRGRRRGAMTRRACSPVGGKARKPALPGFLGPRRGPVGLGSVSAPGSQRGNKGAPGTRFRRISRAAWSPLECGCFGRSRALGRLR